MSLSPFDALRAEKAALGDEAFYAKYPKLRPKLEFGIETTLRFSVEALDADEARTLAVEQIGRAFRDGYWSTGEIAVTRVGE